MYTKYRTTGQWDIHEIFKSRFHGCHLGRLDSKNEQITADT